MPDERENKLSLPPLPAIGEPYNFPIVPDSVLISRLVLADKALLPGSRIMWGVIRQKSYRSTGCTLSYSQLGQDMGCSPGAARKYCRQLRAAGLLRSTLREGTTPMHQLLRGARFTDEYFESQGGYERDGGGIRAYRGGDTSVQGYIRNSGLSGESGERSSVKVERLVSRPAAPAAAVPGAHDRKEKYFSDEERNAIRRNVDAIGLDSTGGCIATLSRKAQYYGRTGFEVAAAIDRAWRKVQRKPSNHPDKVQWIFSVVENEFMQRDFSASGSARTGRMSRASEVLKILEEEWSPLPGKVPH